MKELFEEYGRTIIVIVAVAAVLALLLVRLDFFGVLGSVADVNAAISHNQGESALSEIVSRDKPKADFSRVDTHIYNNHVFRPLKNVVFKDANGAEVQATVSSILYCDSAGNTQEFIDYYNADDDVVILNFSHYSDVHPQCTAAQFSADENGKLVISDEVSRNCPGLVTVTYTAIDSEKQVAVEQLTFVIDGKAA